MLLAAAAAATTIDADAVVFSECCRWLHGINQRQAIDGTEKNTIYSSL